MRCGPPRALYVYLAAVDSFGKTSVQVRGVFGERAEAEALKPGDDEIAHNIVSVFEGVDMGKHVGITV